MDDREAGSEKLRVVLADDHETTRADIRFALEQDARFEVVAEAGDAAGAIAAALETTPDLCLLDVNMPGNGLAATWEIHARLPQTKVVILTVSEDDTTLLGALRAGASGYLLKNMDPRSLPRALAGVLKGEAAVPRALMARVIDEFRDRSPRRRDTAGDGEPSRLTSREWQVLELLREGLGTSQIAQRLVLSPVTVRTHAQAIMRKFEVGSREELLERLEKDRRAAPPI